MKDYVAELEKFTEMVRRNENFALIRFADGEGSIVDNNPEWLSRKRRSSAWEHVPGNKEHEAFRNKLIQSLEYNSPNFYIGIPCTEGHQKRFHYLFKYLMDRTTCPEEQLTFATVFKDYNWKKFLTEFVPLCTRKESYLVSNAFSKMPREHWLKFDDHFTVPQQNAHLKVDETTNNILSHIKEHNTENAVFLFAAGPGTNVIIHKLWQACPNNTYIDIGSTLDNYLFKHSSCGGKSRVYIRKNGAGYRPYKWG